MEPNYGAQPDGDWDLLSKMFSTDEELDFAQQLLGDHILNQELEDKNCAFSQNLSSSLEANLRPTMVNDGCFYPPPTLNASMQYNSENSSYYSSTCINGSTFVPSSNHGNCHALNSDPCIASEANAYVSMDMSLAFPGQELQLKRKFDVPKPYTKIGDVINLSSLGNPKKPRLSREKLSLKGSGEEENNGGQSSCIDSSEDDNTSQEHFNVGTRSDSKASDSNGKTRANGGSASDSQSLYARRRRERINERLRILQSLVPNGTKVDISTMLEEAVHYVKFLQLQIKLLSSDELWMYAPIAYNGIDIGLIQKISSS